MRAGDIPKDKVNEQGIIYSVWLDPSVTEVDDLDHKALFDVHRAATAKVIKKAMHNEPTIDWLLENQDRVTHYFHELGTKGELGRIVGHRSVFNARGGALPMHSRSKVFQFSPTDQVFAELVLVRASKLA